MHPTDNPRGRAFSTLQRVADMNKPTSVGAGIPAGHFIPLCKYHNRSIAHKLIQRLQDSDVRVKIRKTRMYIFLSVAFENRAIAFTILKEFTESHPDTCPKKFSRDYDGVLLIAIATTTMTVVSGYVPAFTSFAPAAVNITGISLGIVIERWHRHYRYRDGLNYSIAEIMILIAIFALNYAIWRLTL